jgi:hypothetical protein
MINNESVAEVVEESEPLGQTITFISPPDDGFDTYTAYKGNVGEPEWQCEAPQEFYGSFSALPWHCQREAMRKIEPLPYEVENPKSPTKIPHPQRPQTEPPATDNAPNRLMKYANFSTSKPMNNEGGSAGENDDDCKWNDGRPECAVQSEPYRESPIEFNNAENEGVPIADIWFIKDKEKDKAYQIRDFIDRVAGNEECIKAFKAIGATPINQQNVIIVTENVFTNPNGDSRWSLGTGIAETMRNQIKATPTTYDMSYGNFEKSGKSFIGITNKALTEEEDLVIIIHSLIHTGGVSGVESEEGDSDGYYSYKAHDLKYKGQLYKDVLKACTKRGGSKLLYGQ